MENKFTVIPFGNLLCPQLLLNCIRLLLICAGPLVVKDAVQRGSTKHLHLKSCLGLQPKIEVTFRWHIYIFVALHGNEHQLVSFAETFLQSQPIILTPKHTQGTEINDGRKSERLSYLFNLPKTLLRDVCYPKAQIQRNITLSSLLVQGFVRMLLVPAQSSDLVIQNTALCEVRTCSVRALLLLRCRRNKYNLWGISQSPVGCGTCLKTN